MNIKEEEGWIYFNELLYRVLRNSYCRFNLNKQMQIRELVTQYKLFNLTMKQIKWNRVNLKERFMRKIGAGGESVNPFLTQMYYRISFLAWTNQMKKWISDQEINRARAIREKRSKDLGLDSVLNDKETQQSAGALYETVEIEVEHLSEWTLDSEEERAMRDPLTSYKSSLGRTLRPPSQMSHFSRASRT